MSNKYDDQSLITKVCDKNSNNTILDKCSIQGCNNKVHAKGLCRKHYMVDYHKNKEKKKDENDPSLCKIHNCKNKVDSEGYCTKHLRQLKEHGRIYSEGYKISHCRVDGCSCKILCRGYCAKHYKMYLKYGKIVKEKNKSKICSIPGCDEKVYCKGMCIKHYSMKRYLEKMEIDNNSINMYLGGKSGDNSRRICRR